MPKVPGRDKKQTLETEKKSTGVGRAIKRAEGEASHVHGEESDTHVASGEGRKSVETNGRDGRVSEGVGRGNGGSGTDGGDGRDGRAFLGVCEGVLGEVARFINGYVDMPPSSVLVSAAWIVASHLTDVWDKFPHLGITSPEKRCGKTTLLDLFNLLCVRPRYTSNISPAALYRLIEKERPTLLMDEAQSLGRKGSDTGDTVRELLNAGIAKNAKVIRCSGEKFDEVSEFTVYGPKVFALIGNLDPILADRCLPVRLERKSNDSKVQRYRSRVVEPEGHAIRERVGQWAEENRERLQGIYDRLDPFDIENDRMADLLLPLQAIMEVIHPEGMVELQRYAEALDARDKEQEVQSPGIRLLVACREIFTEATLTKEDGKFLRTPDLIHRLCLRDEEPWPTYTRGKQITPEALARLLREFGIKSMFNRRRTAKGYFEYAFEEAWKKYHPPTPPLKTASNPSDRFNAAGSKKGGVQ